MSLPQNNPENRTFGQLVEDISKKGILSPVERKAFEQRMIESGFLRRKDEIITSAESARQELMTALGDMHGKDAILSRLDAFFPSGVRESLPRTPEAIAAQISAIAGGRLQEQIKGSGQEVIAAVGAIGGAGSIAEATKGIENLTKGLDGFMKGAGAVMKSITEGMKSILEASGVMGFFRALGRLFRMNPADPAREGDTSPSSTPSDDASRVPAAPPKPPEKTEAERAREREEVKEKTGEALWEKYRISGWIPNPEAQRKKFMEIYNEYYQKVFKDIASLSEKVHSGKEWNAFDELVKYPLGAMRFMLRLIAEGVISKKALAITVYDGARTGIGMYLLSPYTLISNGVSDKLADFGIIDASDLSALDQFEQQALITTLNHTMAPQLYLAGKLSSSLARIGLLGMYWDQGTGMAKFTAMTNSAFGDIEAGISRVDEITKMIGEGAQTEDFRKYKEAITLMKDEAQLRTTIAVSFREGKDAGKSLIDIAEMIEGRLAAQGKSIPGELIGQIRSAQDINGAQAKVIEYVSKGDGAMDNWKRIRQIFSQTVSPLSVHESRMAFFMDDAQRAMRSHGEALSKYIAADWPGARMLANIKHGLKSAELIDALERGHLPLKAQNMEDAKGILQQLIKTIPKGFEHLFAGVTVGLTITSIAKADEGEKLSTAIKNIAAMWPIAGGLILMHEGATMEGGLPTKVGYILGGGAVSALGWREVQTILARNGRMVGAGRIIAAPAMMVYDTVTATYRGLQYAGRMAQFSMRSGAIAGVMGAGEAGIIARGAPTGALGLAALLTFVIAHELFEKQTENALRRIGIVKADGSVDQVKLKVKWQEVPERERNTVIEKILSASSGNMVSYDSKNNKLVIHSEMVDGKFPIDLRDLDGYYRMFAELGMPSPTMYLSKGTTESVRTAIASIQEVSPEIRREWLARFGILT